VGNLVISQEAIQRLNQKFGNAILQNPELLAGMVNKTIKNVDFFSACEKALPAPDPIYFEIQGRLLESLRDKTALIPEIFSASKFIILMFFNALLEEKAVSGQNIPPLVREKVEKNLPSFLLPPGTSLQLQIPNEVSPFVGIIQRMIKKYESPNQNKILQVAVYYPLGVILKLLEEGRNDLQ
jgi:hypothetical protein